MEYFASSIEEAVDFILLNANISWCFWLICFIFCLMGDKVTEKVSALVTGKREKLYSNKTLVFTIGDFWAE